MKTPKIRNNYLQNFTVSCSFLKLSTEIPNFKYITNFKKISYMKGYL